VSWIIPDNATRVDQNKPFEMTCSVRNSDCGVGGYRNASRAPTT